MIILGVMSDTHGNLTLMRRAADKMKKAGAQIFYHLGDDYEDGQALAWWGFETRIIPGLWCPEYRDGRIPNTRIDQVDGLKVACAHSPDELNGALLEAELLFHGHTHRAEIHRRNRRVYVNPGHLKSAKDRGHAPSFALVSIEPEVLVVSIHEMDGSLRVKRRFRRASLGTPEN